MNRLEYERAKELGRQAGRNGTSKDRNPYRGASLVKLRDAWDEGHAEGAAERKVRR